MKAKHILGILATPIVGVTSLLAPVSCTPNKQEFDFFTKEFYENCVSEIEAICAIPRTSNENPEEVIPDSDTDHLKGIRAHLKQRINWYMNDENAAKVDEVGNVWFDILPTSDCKNQEPVILQGHMDMVWDAVGIAKEWDPLKDPVAAPIIEKDKSGRPIMHTKDYLTSLGTDDSQAMGILLSLAKYHDNFSHCHIRCLFTVDEETATYGAQHVSDEVFKIGDQQIKYLVNLDSPHGGQIITTAAGIKKWGHDFSLTPIAQTSNLLNGSYKVSINFSNFTGGHSGEDIDKGRANPLKLLYEELNEFSDYIGDMQLCLLQTDTNTKMNQIPTNAYVELICSNPINNWIDIFQKGFQEKINSYPADKNKARVDVLPQPNGGNFDHPLSANDSIELIKGMLNLPCGPQEDMRFDDHFIGGSANLAPFLWNYDSQNNKINIHFDQTIRFGKADWGEKLVTQTNNAVEKFLNYFGSEQYVVTPDASLDVPVWEEPQGNNPLAKLCFDSHKKFNLNIEYAKCHGGLEASWFAEKQKGKSFTQISIGATIDNEHNVHETLHLDEYLNLCGVLLNMLKNMNI